LWKRSKRGVFVVLYEGNDSLLLCTGLSLKEIGAILNSGKPAEEALKAKGEKYLDRYLTWEKYKKLTESERLKEPVLPLFAAFPCIGKTTMSKEISTAFSIGPVMGGDAFRAALREFIDKEKEPAFFVSVYEAWKMFGEKTDENMIKGFNAQAKIANQAMERLVADRGIRDGESTVYEYLHFLPSQYHKDTLEHPSFIPIVLTLKDEGIWKERVKSRMKKTHLKGGVQRILDILDVYAFFQKNLEREAKEFAIPVVYTDDWDRAVDECISIIIERVKKLNALAGKQLEKTEMQRKYEEERHRAKGVKEEMGK
jgi:mevalonate-3-phosphate-5-kinase